MSAKPNPSGDPALPATGPGSTASWPRRIAALLVDWLLANLVAYVVTGGTEVWDPQRGLAWAPLVSWYVLVVAFTAIAGGSPGQLALDVRVRHIDGRKVSLITSAVRTLLVALVIPPLVFARDGRGLHDLASNTAAIKI